MPTPPPQAIKNTHHNNPISPSFKPSTSLPDLFFAALSLFFLFSKPQFTLFPKIPFLAFPSNPRRFIKIPTMSRTVPNPQNDHRFTNPQSLSDWLKVRLPSDSFASWGIKPGTKNVHNLWLEIAEGETELADSIPPVRTVHVVTVRIIGKDNRILVESHQELSDGFVRNRGRPLSEKMKPDETPESAVLRAVQEELGSILHSCDQSGTVRIVPGSYQKKMEERNSLSYPGLPACYILHSVEAIVDGLPDGEFCTDEEEYGNCDDHETRIGDKAVSVKRHYWKWVSSDSIQS